MRSFIGTTLILTSALLGTGCAVQTDPSADSSSESTTATQDELSKLAQGFVATWRYDRTTTDTTKFYDELTLGADRSYSATTSPDCPPGKACPLYIKLETGSWSVSAKGNLTLRPNGAAKKVFAASLSSDGWQLKITDDAGHALFRRDARVGEHCGGFVANPTECAPGLVCFLGTVADAGGTCMKPVGAGDSCGFRVQTKPCADGLDCKWAGGPRDALTCTPHSAEGQFCGGIAAIACPADFHCVLDGSYPDAGGKCEACAIPSCPPPPAGCSYSSPTVPPGTCRTGCGTLVCGGAGS